MSQRGSEESMMRKATWLFSDGSPHRSLVADLSGMAAPDFVVDEIRSCRVFECFGLSPLVTSRYLFSTGPFDSSIGSTQTGCWIRTNLSMISLFISILESIINSSLEAIRLAQSSDTLWTRAS
jgi:hypothetical protein